MSVEARRATGAALRVTSETFAIATPAERRRAALPPGAARGVGRPRDRVVPAAAVAARARSGRRRAARPRRPARRAAADQRRRRRRAGDRGGAHRRRRLRPGARAPTAARGCRGRWSTGRRRVAILDLPQLRESVAAASAARRRACGALAGPHRRLAQPGRGRLHAGDDRSAGRRGWARWSSPLHAGPTSRFDLGNVAIVDLAYRHARQRHRPRALRRRQCAGGRGGARRLGGAAGGNRRADRAGALPAVAAAARPARHRGRDRQPGAGRCAGRRARRGAGAAADPGGGARARGQLALRAGVEARRRPLLPPARASRPRALACGRSRSPMSSSRGGRRASPATSSSPGPAARGRSPPTAGPRPRRRSPRSARPTRWRSSTARPWSGRWRPATTSVTYTAAQQLADLGALLGPGDTLDRPHLPAPPPSSGRGAPASVYTLQFCVAVRYSPIILRAFRAAVTADSPRREFGRWVVLVRWWTSLRAAWEIRRAARRRTQVIA